MCDEKKKLGPDRLFEKLELSEEEKEKIKKEREEQEKKRREEE